MLVFDALRLRSITKRCPYGVDIRFSDGLNIIQAGNTSGKSTCLQAIIYALGLERSLGPKLEVPLPHAMRQRIHAREDDEYDIVIQSYVELQISNSEGASMVIRRDIEGGSDRKLIKTWDGPRLTDNSVEPNQRDFFVHDQGAAVREGGFHAYLAMFIGWDLPRVPKYDGDECLLYIETIFPMLFVEQKKGWSAIQGPFPTYLGIQDIVRRVLEFLLDLDAGNIRRERTELRRQVSLLTERWRNKVENLQDQAGSLSRIKGIPLAPTAEFAHMPEFSFELFHKDEWRPLDEVTRTFRERLTELEAIELPETEDHAPVLQEKLDASRLRHDELTALLETLRQDFGSERQEHNAIESRLEALDVDLKRNLDAQKLQRLGSVLGSAAGSSACPTCHQELDRELLPEISSAGMAIDENIAFVRSQIDLYRSALASSVSRLKDIEIRYRGLEEELHEKQKEMRSLRQALIRPSESPSRTVIVEAIGLESKLERWQSLQEHADGLVDELKSIAAEWLDLNDRLKGLGAADLTDSDRTKLNAFTRQLQEHLRRYGFKSFQPEDMVLSLDNFRPLVRVRDADSHGEVIEREIGWELSGSDVIRLKWAYYLALFSVAGSHSTNHPKFLVFDEPGQQRVNKKDFFGFVHQLVQFGSEGGQVIVATSEPLENVTENMAGQAHKLINFEGFILQPIAS